MKEQEVLRVQVRNQVQSLQRLRQAEMNQRVHGACAEDRLSALRPWFVFLSGREGDAMAHMTRISTEASTIFLSPYDAMF